MIHDSSKDYDTGEVLMLHDGKTTVQEVYDFLKKCYSQEIEEGDQLEFYDASEYNGFLNPHTIKFCPKN